MNCENFNDRLPEYLEDTLPPAEKAAAQEHVLKCGACQQALAQEKALGKSIRLSFQCETQRLSMRPETKQNILNALKQSKLPPTDWQKIREFVAVLWRHPVWAGTALVCLVLLIFGSRFYLYSPGHPSAQPLVKAERIIYVVDVPIQTEMHVYRRQNNMVVDAVVTEITIMDASFSKATRSSLSSSSQIN